MQPLQDSFYPPNELASPPLTMPLYEPSLAASTEHSSKKPSISPTLSLNDPNDPNITRRNRESYMLSGSIFLITSSGKILNLPVPSSSPADPLNWSMWKTTGAVAAIALYSVVSLTVVQAASLMYQGIMAEFGKQDINPWTKEALVTGPALFVGFGALLWVPLSLGLGRRPVFLLVSLVMLLATIGAGYAKDFRQLLACVCFIGLGEGFSLTSAFLMMIDMTFIHQRPKAVALLWSLAGFAGTSALVIVPHTTRNGDKWRQFYHYWAILMALSLITVFLFYPESYFKRPTVAFDGLILLQSATEKLTVYKDEEAESDLYRDLPDLPNFPHRSPRSVVDRICNRIGLCRSSFASWTALWHCYYQMAFCVINPLIFWVFIASATNFAGMIFMGMTYAQVLQYPPYNLPSSQIVLINICAGVGALLAFPFGGVLVGRVISRLARRNRGVREAEHFLVGYILPVLTGALSTLVYGLAVQYKAHAALYYLAYGLNGFSFTTMSISSTMWVTEAFPRWAAPAISVLAGSSYILSFSMSFAMVPWLAAHGYKLVGIELTVLQILSGLIAVPIAFWGKSARQVIHGKWASERAGALRPL